jgi:hypothetical protein
LKAKLEAEAAIASEKSWYKDQLTKVQAEWSATQPVIASAAAATEWTRETSDPETVKNQAELVLFCNQFIKDLVSDEKPLQVASTNQNTHVKVPVDSNKLGTQHPARRRGRIRQKMDCA